MWRRARKRVWRVTIVFLWQRLGTRRRLPRRTMWCLDRAPVSRCKTPGASPGRSIWCVRSRQDSRRPTASGTCRWLRASGNTSQTMATPKRPTAIIRILAKLSQQLPLARNKIRKGRRSSPIIHIFIKRWRETAWMPMQRCLFLCDLLNETTL